MSEPIGGPVMTPARRAELATLAQRAFPELREALAEVDEAQAEVTRQRERSIAYEARLAAATEALAEVTAYLTHLLATVAPQCDPLPSAAGIATQIDNYIAGRHEALAAKAQEVARLTDELGGYQHEHSLLDVDTQRGVTDCSTPIFQRVRNMLDLLVTAEAALTAERQKVKALRLWLSDPDNRSEYPEWADGVLDEMENLGLTGSEPQ